MGQMFNLHKNESSFLTLILDKILVLRSWRTHFFSSSLQLSFQAIFL